MLDIPMSDWGGGASSVLSLGGSSSGGQGLGAGSSFFDVKINEVAPSEVSGMDVHQIMGILHNLDVEGVTEAADAHMNLASKLDQVASRLARNAHTLAANWQGGAAQAAMDKFQAMHDQAAQLAAQAKQTGQVLHWTAGVMDKYRNLPTPQGESATQADEQTGSHIGGAVGGAAGSAIGDGIGAIAGAFGIGGGNQAKANAQAQKYLTALNQHLVTANNALPSTIGQAPSDWGTSSQPFQKAGGGGAGSGTGGGVASAPPMSPYSGAGAGGGSTAGSAGPAHISKFNAAPLVHGGAGPDASLQGYTPPPGGPTTLPPPGPAPTTGPVGPTGMPTFVPGGPVPNAEDVPLNENALASDQAVAEDGALPGEAMTGADGAAADGLAAEGVPGVSGMGPAGDGAAADLPGVESGAVSGTESAIGADGAAPGEIGAADAMGAEGEGMLPMMGGAGSGQQDKERQRQAWMNEDADLWGVPKDSVGSVIEGNG